MLVYQYNHYYEVDDNEGSVLLKSIDTVGVPKHMDDVSEIGCLIQYRSRYPKGSNIPIEAI